MNIPFCAPSLKVEWDVDFANYLTKEYDASIGTVYASLGQESRDFKINNYFPRKEILSDECKYSRNGIDPSDIKYIMKKLLKYSSPLKIITCSRLANSSNLKSCLLKTKMNLPCTVLVFSF
jgi:hypothetical protein